MWIYLLSPKDHFLHVKKGGKLTPADQDQGDASHLTPFQQILKGKHPLLFLWYPVKKPSITATSRSNLRQTSH